MIFPESVHCWQRIMQLMQRSFRDFLKAVHVEVECVDNGEAALSRYQNMPDYYYDMIFMDLNMPIMDGYEAAKSIRGSGKAGRIGYPDSGSHCKCDGKGYRESA